MSRAKGRIGSGYSFGDGGRRGRLSTASSCGAFHIESMATMYSKRTMIGLLSKESAASVWDDPRAQTLKGRIIAPYVEGHFAATYEGLKMYGPIFKFADREIEKDFQYSMNMLILPIFIQNALFGMFTNVARLFIMFVFMYYYLAEVYIPYYAAMAVVEASAFGTIACFLLVPKIKSFREHSEITMYSTMSAFLLIIYAGSIAILTMPQLFTAPESDQVALLSISFVSSYYYYLLLIAVPAATMPSRAKFLVYVMAGGAIGMTAVVAVFGGSIRRIVGQDHVTALEIISYLSVWSWALIFFCSRCLNELKARVDFFQYASAKKKVAKLKKEMRAKKRTNQGGTTGVEEILKWLNEAIDIVRDVGAEINAVELQESLNLMDETILKLTNTDKLFSVDLAKMSGHDQESARTVMNAFGNTNLKNLLEARHNMSSSPIASPSPVRLNHKRFSMKSSAAPVIYAPPGEADVGVGDEHAAKPDAGAVALTCVLGDVFKENAGRKWDFNVLEYSEETKNILVEMGMALVAPSVRQSHADQNTAQRLFIEIQKRYFANPYHNAIHGATVAHTSMSLCRMLGIHKGLSYDPQSELTLIVSALGHDMGHPGRNNAFFINCVHPIAALYNDASVLENLHCALLFTLLSKPELNLFDSLSFEEFMILRYRIIDLVLATDMKMHFESLTKFRVRRASPEFDFDKNVEDMWLMLKMCLKAADLSHGALQWTQHIEWSMRVTEEFYKQGDNEVLMGMPKSPLCDRDTHKGLAKSQKGFIGFVVHPLYIELDAAANGALQSTCMIRLAENTVRWEERASLEVVTPMPEAISVIPTHVRQLKGLVCELLPANIEEVKAACDKLTRKNTKATQTDPWADDDDEDDYMDISKGLSGAVCNYTVGVSF